MEKIKKKEEEQKVPISPQKSLTLTLLTHKYLSGHGISLTHHHERQALRNFLIKAKERKGVK
jgi:hypothetical protein